MPIINSWRIGIRILSRKRSFSFSAQAQRAPLRGTAGLEQGKVAAMRAAPGCLHEATPEAETAAKHGEKQARPFLQRRPVNEELSLCPCQGEGLEKKLRDSPSHNQHLRPAAPGQ